MHALFTILTAALLAGHAFVGCCWREHTELAHSDNCAACERHLQTPHGCCPAEEHESPDPCSCRLDCQKLCQYVSPERVLTAADGGFVAFVAILPPRALLGAGRTQLAEGQPPGWLDPQRIQLQHQILLI